MSTELSAVQEQERFRGRVVYIFAFDIAYEFRPRRIGRVLGRPTVEYCFGESKRIPRELFFYRPEMVCLPSEARTLFGRPVEIVRQVKLFSMGALSILFQAPFEDRSLRELVDYHDLNFETVKLEHEALRLAKEIKEDIASYCARPTAQLESEAYTIFCLDQAQSGPMMTEGWFDERRRLIAGLLTQEAEVEALSEQEVEESTAAHLSYYKDDLAVIDWDAALIVGGRDTQDEILHIAELANVQLMELRAYDRILDSSLGRAYTDLAHWRMRLPGRVMSDLREIRIDMVRLTDELENTTKFIGDWHLARIYQQLYKRFHLADWNRVIDRKLGTLGDLYQLLREERTNLWMVILELTIVLLFIFDVILLLAGL